METRVIKVPAPAYDQYFGHFTEKAGQERLAEWTIDGASPEAIAILREAGTYLATNDTPVAFPTETVYGLGADATRSAAVKGIYSAKGRPSDNPLIVHVCDLAMLRGLISSSSSPQDQDPIPAIYKPLIDKFWPGPLTLLLPNPTPSKLAPEVTAGLPTFGARMPSSTLALSLIKLAGVPLAAPSANASTKPSPTAAHHVEHDLKGRIEMILDGGPSNVGVESTVVDGTCQPPVVLRPGGVSIEEIRACKGWEDVQKAYKDQSEEGKAAPRAPGMKYKHYSPKARVVLYETSFKDAKESITQADREALATSSEIGRVGVIRTYTWPTGAGLRFAEAYTNGTDKRTDLLFDVLQRDLVDDDGQKTGELLDINLGSDTRNIAQGLFSALRELDSRGADVIFVEGIDDRIDIAAAVMNRLRKAASETRS